MAGVTSKGLGRVVLTGVAALTIGTAFDGCGGTLERPIGGTGGAVGDPGQAGTVGMTARGGTGGDGPGGTGGGGFGQPACPGTVTKGGPCTTTDIPLCYKACGPESIGVKSETCSTGVYMEMAGCTFDATKDYSCYSVPTTPNPACGDESPQASGACSLPPCMLCNSSGGILGGSYIDSAGAAHVGYCVCSSVTKKWSCASETSWPCPAGRGCAPVTGTGGATGSGGSMGVAGATGSGGTAGGAGAGGGAGGTGGFGQPACPTTVTKGGACASTDIQFCYKTCGPEKTGVKSETCSTAGVYSEMSGCAFDPNADYSCYQVGPVANPVCPTGMPMASQTCSTAVCTPCNSSQGAPGGQYLDASGAQKVGYCVCQFPNAAGARVWSCASDTQWPCPMGNGCTGTGGSGGSTGAGSGTGGAGGGAGGTGGGGSFGQPACPATITKGGACSQTDLQFCYKTCGPEKSGVKSETCQSSGVYAEMSGCGFDPGRDYSCYKLPTTSNLACTPGVTPMVGATCDVAACTVCNSVQGLPGGGYLDSTGAAKTGYCVCQAPNSSGIRTWSCANDTAWPCPANSGC